VEAQYPADSDIMFSLDENPFALPFKERRPADPEFLGEFLRGEYFGRHGVSFSRSVKWVFYYKYEGGVRQKSGGVSVLPLKIRKPPARSATQCGSS
jgi:hypothetical protein